MIKFKFMTTGKKIILILFLISTPAIIFYFLNFDFRGSKSMVCDSLCSEADLSKGKIPQSWLDRYEIKIESEADLNKDHDNDGLNLIEEYNNSTDPLDSDTDKDKYVDGQEVRNGYSPVGEGRLDLDRDNLPDFWEKESGLDPKKNDYNGDNDQDGLLNYRELAHGTNPLVADTDNDGFNDLDEVKNGYDPVALGDAKPTYQVKIQKIGIEAPIIWSLSADEASMLEDLKSGVTRFPETGIPGQRGNAVISGHSSNYIWAPGNYNYIFKDLNNLQNGDEVVLSAVQKNGKSFEYKYKVTGKSVVAADDAEIFQNSDKPTITLVTCWPLRTNWKRLIVQAEMQ
jgi:LPXTG-site transpeptidase (sortase) family protein